MPAGLYDITAEQGATFSRVLTWRDATSAPVDLYGFSAAMQVRKSLEAATPMLSLSSANNGGITMGGASGQITITASASTMSQLKAGSYYYDLEVTNRTGVIIRLLQGKFTVTREVTR